MAYGLALNVFFVKLLGISSSARIRSQFCSLMDYTSLFRDPVTWIFSCAPLYVMQPPITQPVSLHIKSFSNNIARAYAEGNNMQPLDCGHKQKRSNYLSLNL